jgi:hypothetical protein
MQKHVSPCVVHAGSSTSCIAASTPATTPHTSATQNAEPAVSGSTNVPLGASEPTTPHTQGDVYKASDTLSINFK